MTELEVVVLIIFCSSAPLSIGNAGCGEYHTHQKPMSPCQALVSLYDITLTPLLPVKVREGRERGRKSCNPASVCSKRRAASLMRVCAATVTSHVRWGKGRGVSLGRVEQSWDAIGTLTEPKLGRWSYV